MKIISFFLVFLYPLFIFGQFTEEKASDVLSKFILFNNLDDSHFSSLDWRHVSNIAHQYWTVDSVKKTINHLESKNISPSSILNLIQSPDYLQIHGDIHPSFFEISQLEFEELKDQTSGEISASDTFFNFVSELLMKHHTDEEVVMGEGWIENIMNHIDSWTVVEARKFLNFLNSKRVRPESILRVLKSTDYLRALRTSRINIVLEKAVSQTSLVPDPQFEGNHVESVQGVNKTIREVTKRSQASSDIFIDYVREYFKEEFEVNGIKDESLDDYINRQMVSSKSRSTFSWIDRINDETGSWTINHAVYLLNFLEGEMNITPLTIVKMLKAVSFFTTTYEGFRGRIDIYSKYLTKEDLKERLENSFSSFQFGKPENIRELLLLLESRIGKRDTYKILNSNLKGIATASGRLLRLDQNIIYLEDYLGEGNRVIGRVKLNDIIRNGGFSGVVDFKVRKNTDENYENDRVRWLKERGLSQKKIIELIEKNPITFSSGDLSKDKITYLEQYLGGGDEEIGRVKLDKVIKRGGFRGILMFGVKKDENGNYNNDRVKWLEERGLSQEEIIKLIERNPLTFYGGGDLSEGKIAYLENYLGEGNREVGKVKVNEIIKRGGFLGIVEFKTRKNKNNNYENDRVKWLEERNLSQEDIIELIEKNPKPFSRGDLSEVKIAYLENYLGEGNREMGKVKLDEIIKRGGFLGIVGFRVRKNKAKSYENERVEWLRKRGLLQKEIIELIEKNPQTFFVGDLFEDKIAYLENYLGKGDKEKGKIKLNVIIKRGGFAGIVEFKVKKKVKGYTNEQVEWLEERGVSQERIIELIGKNPLAFSRGDLFEDKIAYLENYLGEGDRKKGKAKLDEIVKRGGFLGIVDFKVEDDKEGNYGNKRVKWLEARDLFQKEIIELIEKNPLAFSRGDLSEDKIAYLENYLGAGSEEDGKTKLNEIIKKGGFLGIVQFKITNRDNEKVSFLKEIGYNISQIMWLMENHIEIFSSDLSKDLLKTHVEKLIQERNVECVKSLI